MARAARWLEPIICLVAACRGSQRAPHDAAASAPPPSPRPADAAPPADASRSAITITIGRAHPAGGALARRCTLAGAPIDSDDCSQGSSIALDRAGILYVTARTEVRRYRRTAGEGCAYEPAGPALALPPEQERKQSLSGGSLYFRSGGPEWRLAVIDGAVYAHDFLAGLYRLGSAAATPACTDVYGYDSLAALDGKLYIARTGIEQFALGPHCKASPAHIDDKLRTSSLYAAAGHIYAGSFDLARYDGTTKVLLGGDPRICYVRALAACGDGVCALDSNCQQLVELDASGKTIRAYDADQLFDARPWLYSGLATEGDKGLLISTSFSDHLDGKSLCETAIYELPAAALAP